MNAIQKMQKQSGKEWTVVYEGLLGAARAATAARERRRGANPRARPHAVKYEQKCVAQLLQWALRMGVVQLQNAVVKLEKVRLP